jgi:K+ transporter
VYIPLINYLLMGLCLIITGTFQTSANIGKAYGARCAKCMPHSPSMLCSVPSAKFATFEQHSRASVQLMAEVLSMLCAAFKGASS